MARHDAANHLAIDLLQCPIIAALVGQQERVPGADSLDQVAVEQSALDIVAKLPQLLLVRCTPPRDFALFFVDNGQLGETGRKMRVGMSGVERQRLREIGGSLFIAADFQQTAATLVPRFGVARIDVQCRCKILDCIIGAIETDQHAAAVVARLLEIRRDRQGLVVAGERFGQAIETLHRGAAIVEGLEVVWAQCQCMIKAHQGFIVSTKQTQRRAAVEMRVGVVLLQSEGLAEAFKRLLVASEPRQNRTAIIVRFGKFGLLLQCRIEARQRFFAAIKRVQDHAVIQQDLRRGFAHAHRLGDQAEGIGGLAFGELDDAQHLQGVEMVGPMREHLRIELLCFRQLALFVQRKRLREDLRHIEWCGLGQLRWRHEHPLYREVKKPR